MATLHFLGSIVFAKNKRNPNTVKLNPRGLTIKKGKANRAPSVIIIFLKFISEDRKIGFSFSPHFLKLAMIRFAKERIPSIKEARKDRNPGPGASGLPTDALAEEMHRAKAIINKKKLLF